MGRALKMTEAGLLKEKIGSLRWAIALSFLLTLVKGVAAFFTASQALLASALDSLMDMGISSVNLLSVHKASKPPDEDHAYGHEKIESLAAYSQGILILVFAFLLFGEGFRRTLAGSFIHRSGLALLAVGFSMGVNFWITAILQRAEQRTGSLIVKVEKTHYFMDILSYAVIIVSLVLVRVTGWPNWDLVGGIFVGGYVVFLAGQILIQA